MKRFLAIVVTEPGRYYTSGGYINQLDIRRGGWLGYAIWRQP